MCDGKFSRDFSGISHFFLIYGRCVGFGKVGFGISDSFDLSLEALISPPETSRSLPHPSCDLVVSHQTLPYPSTSLPCSDSLVTLACSLTPPSSPSLSTAYAFSSLSRLRTIISSPSRPSSPLPFLQLSLSSLSRTPPRRSTLGP